MMLASVLLCRDGSWLVAPRRTTAAYVYVLIDPNARITHDVTNAQCTMVNARPVRSESMEVLMVHKETGARWRITQGPDPASNDCPLKTWLDVDVSDPGGPSFANAVGRLGLRVVPLGVGNATLPGYDSTVLQMVEE